METSARGHRPYQHDESTSRSRKIHTEYAEFRLFSEKVTNLYVDNNSDVLAILAQNAAKAKSSTVPTRINVKKTNMNNALMQLRK